ncbi:MULTISPECIES: substrate-binding domain-containing protein [Rhodobacterales]|uniref:substrate-binding domain-containing protein n=1 Tax=Rhodobacterales TaxID=204455 RepID=UPI002852EF18|nr:substrate-binding domain-containing protein [Loktanella sp. D2R18]
MYSDLVLTPSRSATSLTGTIRLGLYDQSSANPDAHIHDAIATFDKVAPRVKIELSFDTLTALENGVFGGKLDLAVVPVFLPNTALKIERLYAETMRLYCGKGHEMFGQDTANIAPHEILSSHKYAGYAFNSPNMQAGNRLNLIRAANVKDEEALALLVQSGRYIGFLADHYAENSGGQERYWPLFPTRLSYDVQFAAIYRQQPAPDRKTSTFLDCLLRAHDSARS